MEQPTEVPKDGAKGDSNSIATEEVLEQIRERLGRGSYAMHFSRVTWHYTEGTLTLHGRVSTFYMKQVLQTILREVVHVRRLINHVDVVRAASSSGEPPR